MIRNVVLAGDHTHQKRNGHSKNCDRLYSGGEGGIRTHETLAGLPVFKTGTFNHSVTSPCDYEKPGGERGIRTLAGACAPLTI